MDEIAENKEYIFNNLKDAKVCLKVNLNEIAQSFVQIGYVLKNIRDCELYKQDGYSSLNDFAQAEYKLNKTSVNYYMRINDEFSVGGNGFQLEERYKDFDKGKLREMLTLPEQEREKVTPDMTVKEIRSLKPKKEKMLEHVEGEIVSNNVDNISKKTDINKTIDNLIKIATSQQEHKSDSIDDLDLSVRTYNTLKRAGINKVSEIINMTDTEFAKIRNMSKSQVDEIKVKVKKYGYIKDDINSDETYQQVPGQMQIEDYQEVLPDNQNKYDGNCFYCKDEECISYKEQEKKREQTKEDIRILQNEMWKYQDYLNSKELKPEVKRKYHLIAEACKLKIEQMKGLGDK